MKYINLILRNKFFKTVIIVISILILVIIYLHFSLSFSKENVNMENDDQAAFLNFSKKVYTSKYKYTGGRNRMPVYPFILSLVYEQSLSDEEFFVRSKNLSIVLSILILCSLFIIFIRYLKLKLSSILILIIAFSIFIHQASYVQVELLFYFLNFCSFLLMCKMFFKPTIKLSLLTGIVLGISHLTKASVIPGIDIVSWRHRDTARY